MNKKTLFLAGGLFLSSLSVFSQKDTVDLNEVLVTANKVEVNRNQIPLTVSIVGRETIDESTETGVLSIVSEQVPGVFVTERGVTGYGISNGSAGTVNIHGVGGGNRVLMLFDGQPMWAGIFGHHIPDVYVSSDAEKVEVVRGPASLLYGSNAMGGVINVITRKAKEDGLHGQARAIYGTYDTWKIMGSAGYKKDKFNAFVSLNRDQSAGQRDNSAFYINNGYIRLGYEISDNWNVNGEAIIADFKVNNPGAIDAPAIENWAKALRSTYSIAVNNKYDKMSGSVQAFYNIGKHKLNDGWKNGAPRPYFFRSTDENRGFSLFESFRLFDGNLFTVGVDAKQWGGHAWNDSINGNKGEIIDKMVTEIAGYALVQQTLFEKLTLNAGIRFENNEGYGSEWIPQAGATYQLCPQTSFKASASRGFRSPNLRELYLYAPANPELKPENMNNYDISYLQSLLNNKLQLELTAYYAEGSNLISTAMVAGKPLNINTGTFYNKGVDFAVTYRPLPNLKIAGNYSFLLSNINITAAPKHKAFVGVDYKICKFVIAPSFQYVDGLYLGTANNTDVFENCALLNCKLSYKVNSQLTFFVNGENLTDVNYATYLGFPMPGVTVMGGMNLNF